MVTILLVVLTVFTVCNNPIHSGVSSVSMSAVGSKIEIWGTSPIRIRASDDLPFNFVDTTHGGDIKGSELTSVNGGPLMYFAEATLQTPLTLKQIKGGSTDLLVESVDDSIITTQESEKGLWPIPAALILGLVIEYGIYRLKNRHYY